MTNGDNNNNNDDDDDNNIFNGDYCDEKWSSSCLGLRAIIAKRGRITMLC